MREEFAFGATPDDGEAGRYAYELAKELFPIARSLTGPGVRETLEVLKRELPGLEVHAVPSGTQVFDWEVPDEWHIRDAFIEGPDGKRLGEFQESNLHVLGYSEPVDRRIDLDELQTHLYSLPDLPDAIPYVTSYYTRRWGFCLRHRDREALRPGTYRVKIDATLEPGVLNYGELTLPGDREDEIFLSTYICHPSLANNELSGPVVATALGRWLRSRSRRPYSIRLVFVPETIGSITYLSRNLPKLKERVRAGFNISCIGDDRAYSWLPSRAGDTLADRAALHALRHVTGSFVKYTWWDRGSDERQYCAPGVDLPVTSIMRSKYGEYPEYHTSLDNLDLISRTGLEGGFRALQAAIVSVELDAYHRMTVLGEPQLGKRGLYPTVSTRSSGAQVRRMMNLISQLDGHRSLLDIAEALGEPIWELDEIVQRLTSEGLVERGR